MKRFKPSVLALFTTLLVAGWAAQAWAAAPRGKVAPKVVPKVTPALATVLKPGLVFLPLAPFQSTWAATAPKINGQATAAEWGEAAKMNLPHGVLRIQNDLEWLYLLIDVTGDTGDDAMAPTSPWGDYFWLVWDVDGDRNVTPGDDLLHGLYPGTTRLGLCQFVQPGAVTGLQATTSRAARGFGATPDSATPHRVWELAVSLEEIGADPGAWARDPLDAHPLRMGLHIHSEQPLISDYLPQNLLNDFSRLYRILLAFGPSVSGVGGPIFATVGVIPSTEIVGGYATTDPSYMLYVKDAPFGGSLNLFGHFDGLRSRGAKYYQVLARPVGGGAYEPLRLTWSNYRWETDRFVLRQIAPDAQDRYEISPAAEIWSLRDLLVRWPTRELPNGRWELKVALFDASKNPLPEPTPGNHLVLMLDNTPPVASILAASHGGSGVGECAIVNLGPAPDGLRFTFTARDNQGHLGGYSLVAYYGDNRTDPRGPITSDAYSHHVSPSRLWAGVTAQTVPAAPAQWRAPVSCAYQFRLTAYDRTTDGYVRHIHWASYSKHLTILMEGLPLPPPAVEEEAPVAPPGVKLDPKLLLGTKLQSPALRLLSPRAKQIM